MDFSSSEFLYKPINFHAVFTGYSGFYLLWPRVGFDTNLTTPE